MEAHKREREATKEAAQRLEVEEFETKRRHAEEEAFANERVEAEAKRKHDEERYHFEQQKLVPFFVANVSTLEMVTNAKN